VFRSCQIRFVISCLIFFLIFVKAYAKNSFKNIQNDKSSTIIKANQVDGDQKNMILRATGDVEISKGLSKITADEVAYDKKNKKIEIKGNIVANNLEVGRLNSSEAEVKDDFTSGYFKNAEMIFNDGSYIKASKVEKKNPISTIFYNPIYSFCPNDEIANNSDNIGKKKNFAAIRSKKTKIDKESQSIKTTHGFFEIYDVPVFYTPYFSAPLSSDKKETGFLFPSYDRNNQFGIGVRLPFYANIAPNKDLLITPKIGLDGEKYLITNNFRHLTSYGQYDLSLEFANNKINSEENDATIVNRSSNNIRWLFQGKGDFDFNENFGFDYSANTLSDSSYLRDYQNDYLNYSLTQANFDYIKDRDYFAIKASRFQELENYQDQKQQQFVLPQIDHETTFRSLLFSEQISLKSNITAINRESGLQYHRMTFIPEILLPFNVYGNLINAKFLLQNDFYWFDQNYKYNENHVDYKKTQINQRPKFVLDWSLPLIKKNQESTILIEPMASFVSTKSVLSYNKIANEDSQDSELTFSNIFSDDYLSGYDRNEADERFGYGVKSSLFNNIGEFFVGLGQSYRVNNETQDVAIKGYSQSNKSNFVGKAMYKFKRNFSLSYTFQLNENNYRNDINEINLTANYDRFSFGTNYTLIRRTLQNDTKREQINLSSSIKLLNRWKISANGNRDLRTGKILSKRIDVYRNGCCTEFGFYAIESNPENFNKPVKTYGLNLTFKNL